MAIELAVQDPAYEDVASKFFEHFVYIASAMNDMGGTGIGLWDPTAGFYYDVLHLGEEKVMPMKVRSMVGLTFFTLCGGSLRAARPGAHERVPPADAVVSGSPSGCERPRGYEPADQTRPAAAAFLDLRIGRSSSGFTAMCSMKMNSCRSTEYGRFRNITCKIRLKLGTGKALRTAWITSLRNRRPTFSAAILIGAARFGSP